MDNNYSEQLVVETNLMPYKVFKYGCFVFIFLALVSTGINLLLSVFFLIIAIILFFLKRKSFLEYEYIAVQDQLDFSVISEQIRRKKALSIDLRQIEIMARKNSLEFKDFSNKPSKIKKFYSNSSKDDIFCLVTLYKKERIIIEFTPSDKILQHCFRFNPRNVKR